MSGRYNKLRVKMIARDLPQTFFDSHVNNATLYLVDVKSEQSPFCM